jgi:phenolic acid decarboxylase
MSRSIRILVIKSLVYTYDVFRKYTLYMKNPNIVLRLSADRISTSKTFQVRQM